MDGCLDDVGSAAVPGEGGAVDDTGNGLELRGGGAGTPLACRLVSHGKRRSRTLAPGCGCVLSALSKLVYVAGVVVSADHQVHGV
jgi:hypothetical protein